MKNKGLHILVTLLSILICSIYWYKNKGLYIFIFCTAKLTESAKMVRNLMHAVRSPNGSYRC